MARRRPIGATLPLLAALTVGQAACAAVGLGGTGVDRGAIDRTLGQPPLDQVHFGVLAVDAADGRVLYARNAEQKFIPASNQKILATSAALSLLGPDFTYETALWAAGPVEDGVLDGDLVLPGDGDPTLSETYWESGEAALRALADSLRAAGVHRVTGSLVVDASAWDSTSVRGAWMIGDGAYRYASTGGAFAIEQGELHLVLQGGAAEGDPVHVEWHPAGSEAYVSSDLTTAPPDSTTRVRTHYLPESRRIHLTGRVAMNAVDTLLVAMRDPVRQSAQTLLRALEGSGVDILSGSSIAWEKDQLLGGGCRTGAIEDCPGAERLASIASPTMAVIVAGILEPSQNWMAEQVIRTLGGELGGEAGWSEGTSVLSGFLADSVGVDTLDFRAVDGSGLSAHNLVTPRALVAVLRYMAQGPHGTIYRHALAEPGEDRSTLSRRLAGLEGRVFAKTGTISNVNSLSGYLVRDDGREVIFSILSNGSGLESSQVRSAIDDVVRILAR